MPSLKDIWAEAEELERLGKNHGAAIRFEQAYLLAQGQKSCEALHRRAINLRLAKIYATADITFEFLLTKSNVTPEHRARIRRDYGMLLLDQDRPHEAFDEFQRSSDELTSLGNETEAAVSIGFLGRGFYALGINDMARANMRQADEVLRRSDNRTYELNNLIWLMQVVETTRQRYELLRRATALSQQTGYRRRRHEAQIIALSPRLYKLLKRLH